MKLAALVVLTLLGLPAGPAAAATVTGYVDNVDYAVIRDSEGERNRLQIRVGTAVVIRDRRPLTARGTCRQIDVHTVRCPAEVFDVYVHAGDGDDRVDVMTGAIFTSMTGGAGDDRLDAGDGAGELNGGDGDDVLRGDRRHQNLYGGPGDDRLSGGRGRDRLDGDAVRSLAGGREQAPGNDVLDGGPGPDVVTYEWRRKPVVVDLSRQIAFSARDRDRLRSIEHATGGRRADRLVGTERRNRLYGGNGRDTLIGLGGNDRLDVSGLLPTVLFDDDGDRDRFECGAGDDIVAGAVDGVAGVRRPEPIEPDCERLSSNLYGDLDGFVLRVQPLEVVRGRMLVRVTCTPERSHCRRRAAVLAAGVQLGRSRLVRVRAGVRRVPVRLRRPLPAPGALVEIRAAGPDDYRVRYRLRR